MRVCLGFLEMKIMFRYTTSHDFATSSGYYYFFFVDLQINWSTELNG